MLSDGRVAISPEAYLTLLEASTYYDALHAGGVDNWDWYGDSVDEADLTEFEAAVAILEKRKETA